MGLFADETGLDSTGGRQGLLKGMKSKLFQLRTDFPLFVFHLLPLNYRWDGKYFGRKEAEGICWQFRHSP